MADSSRKNASRVSRQFAPRTLFVTLASLGSIVFIITAYALVHFVDGLPRYASVLFALVVLAAISLSVLVTTSLIEVFRSTKAGLRGARLHRRLVGLLSLVAVLPAIIAFSLTGTVLRAFSDEYFVDRVTDANLVARDLANGYATAESRKMGLDILVLASDLARQTSAGLTPEDAPIGFRRYLLGQSILRDFSAVVLLDRDGKVIVEVAQRPNKRYRLPPPQDFRDVSAPQATPFKFNAHDQNTIDAYYALLKLGLPDEGFLIAYKDENPALSKQLVRVRDFRDQTTELRDRLGDLSLMFAVGYGLVMLLLLLGAVWIGLLVSNAIVGPVRRLAVAAESVSGGDLSSRVDVRKGDGELGDLGNTFNEMTRQLEGQRADLIAANTQSEARRRFIETVVSGVPAGVLNVATDGRIALANPSADRILAFEDGGLVGKNLHDVSVELGKLLNRAIKFSGAEFRDQAELHRRGVARIINVRISPDDLNRRTGYVFTLDDITELVSAQRNAAWGDVARRIAHEIKNPLTPIQLAAERLKRKYGDHLGRDREIFDRCTDTIIRHVGDIGRMVNEFSSFARMPEPIIAAEDLREVARSAAFSFGGANPSIDMVLDLPDDEVIVRCDGRLIGQALVNLIKNAVESITEDTDRTDGKIVVHVSSDGSATFIEIRDNGRGLPKEGRSRLTEPYMTTREKGTGLGLAIVRKAIEEHGGTFALIGQGVNGGVGATAQIVLPRTEVVIATDETKIVTDTDAKQEA